MDDTEVKGRRFVNKNQSNKSNPRKKKTKKKEKCVKRKTMLYSLRFIVRAHFFIHGFVCRTQDDESVRNVNKHKVALVTEKNQNLYSVEDIFREFHHFCPGICSAPLMVLHRLIYDRKATTETRLYSSHTG